MSRDNAELARAAIDAWNRGDIEAGLALSHQDVQWLTSGVFPGLDRVYRGHDGFRRFWQDFREPWEAVLIAVDEIRDYGDDVVVLFTFEARGRDGLEVRREAGNVMTFRDGLLVRNETFADWASALQAASAE